MSDGFGVGYGADFLVVVVLMLLIVFLLAIVGIIVDFYRRRHRRVTVVPIPKKFGTVRIHTVGTTIVPSYIEQCHLR